MIVSNCPRCHEDLCVPAGQFPEDAYAKCPWCRETFPLADVLTSLPPVLQIVSAEGEPITAHPPVLAGEHGSTAAAQGVAAMAIDQPLLDEPIESDAGGIDFGHPAAAETDSGEDGSGSFEFDQASGEELDSTVRMDTVHETISDETISDEPSAEQGDDDAFPALQAATEPWDAGQMAAPVADMKVSPGRRKQKKGAPIKTAIMVILGGVAAFPVAGVILWAVGRPLPVDLGFWPFNGASSSSRPSVAAPPVDLSARTSGTKQNPVALPLDSGAGSESISVAGDPADSALQQIMDSSGGEGPSGKTDDAPVAATADSSDDPSMTITPDAKIATSPVAIVPIDADADRSTAEATGPDAAAAPPADDAALLQMPTDPPPAPLAGSRKSAVDGPPKDRQVARPKPKSDDADAPKPPPTEPGGESVPDGSLETIAAAERAVDALLTFEGSKNERRLQLVRTYAKVAAACDVGSDQNDALRRLAGKIGNSSILDDIGYAGDQWLQYKGRSSNGIALIGQPGTGDQGPTLTLASGKVVPLVGGGPLPAAEKVLAMGRLADGGASVELVLAEPLP